ncbi:MAG: hypothetical protein AAF726_23950 [Planctomycetota bacterium]
MPSRLLAAVLSLALAASAAAQSLFEAHPIATVPDEVELEGPPLIGPDGTEYEVRSRLVWSPDGLQVAYVGYRDGATHPVVGNTVEKSHDYVNQPAFGPTGDIVVFRIGDRRSKKKESWFLYRGPNEKPSKKQDWIGTPSISPDGERIVAWTQPGAKLDAQGYYTRRNVVFWGGWKRGKKWSDALCLQEPVFSATGDRVFTAVQKGPEWSVVAIDRKGETEIEKGFSLIREVVAHPGGEKVATTANVRAEDVDLVGAEFGALMGAQRVVYEGEVYGAEFDHSCAPVFSPDGQHLAYKVVKDESMGIAIDGEAHAGTPWDYVTRPVFAPGGELVAYVGNRGSELRGLLRVQVQADLRERGGVDQLVVADLGGTERTVGETAQRIDHVTWGPGEEQLAYAARTEDGWRIVCGDAASEPFDEIGPPVFDESGSKIAFGARKDRAITWEVLDLGE